MKWLRILLGRCLDCGEPDHQTVDEQWEAHRCSNCGVDHTGKPCSLDRCAYLAKGFCAASIDGYCIGGYVGHDNEYQDDPICHG